jgi:hypothetical protein
VNGFFDFDRFEELSEAGFDKQEPYPFLNPLDLVTPEGWEQLRADLPPIDLFAQKFGKRRYSGQIPHDRFSLEYTNDVPVSAAWNAFIDELRTPRYRATACKLMGVRSMSLRFHWHYTPAGLGVSPHIDQQRELGSHIFYFNSREWTRDWGGETVLLGSQTPFKRRAAPKFDDFEHKRPAECIGNRSLVFKGRKSAWHAVRPIECPPDEMRRVFIVVYNTTEIYWRVRDWLIGKQVQQF